MSPMGKASPATEKVDTEEKENSHSSPSPPPEKKNKESPSVARATEGSDDRASEGATDDTPTNAAAAASTGDKAVTEKESNAAVKKGGEGTSDDRPASPLAAANDSPADEAMSAIKEAGGVWECNVCGASSFVSHEDALQHEMSCEGSKKKTSKEKDDGEEGEKGSETTAKDAATATSPDSSAAKKTETEGKGGKEAEAKEAASTKATPPNNTGRVYLCKACGQPKAGHKCPVKTPASAKKTPTTKKQKKKSPAKAGRTSAKAKGPVTPTLETRLAAAAQAAMLAAADQAKRAASKAAAKRAMAAAAKTATAEVLKAAPSGTVVTWTCDICKVESFSNYEEAAAHEDACAKKKKQEEDKPWLCDVCQVRRFKTYEQAVRHEKECAKKQKAKPGRPRKKKVDKQKESESEEEEDEEIVAQESPIVEGKRKRNAPKRFSDEQGKEAKKSRTPKTKAAGNDEVPPTVKAAVQAAFRPPAVTHPLNWVDIQYLPSPPRGSLLDAIIRSCKEDTVNAIDYLRGKAPIDRSGAEIRKQIHAEMEVAFGAGAHGYSGPPLRHWDDLAIAISLKELIKAGDIQAVEGAYYRFTTPFLARRAEAKAAGLKALWADEVNTTVEVAKKAPKCVICNEPMDDRRMGCHFPGSPGVPPVCVHVTCGRYAVLLDRSPQHQIVPEGYIMGTYGQVPGIFNILREIRCAPSFVRGVAKEMPARYFINSEFRRKLNGVLVQLQGPCLQFNVNASPGAKASPKRKITPSAKDNKTKTTKRATPSKEKEMEKESPQATAAGGADPPKSKDAVGGMEEEEEKEGQSRLTGSKTKEEATVTTKSDVKGSEADISKKDNVVDSSQKAEGAVATFTADKTRTEEDSDTSDHNKESPSDNEIEKEEKVTSSAKKETEDSKSSEEGKGEEQQTSANAERAEI